MSNFQLSKLKSGIKNATKLTLKISSNVVGDSNIENKLLHKLLLTKVLIDLASIDSNISHDEYISINNVFTEYDDMKEEI